MRRTVAAACGAVLLLALAGCGSDDSAAPAPETTSSAAAPAAASDSPSDLQTGPASWPGNLARNRTDYLADLQKINAGFSDSDLDAGLLACADVAAGKAGKVAQDAAVARLTRPGLSITSANGKAIVIATIRWVCPELGAE